jgi:hypothetical protein
MLIRYLLMLQTFGLLLAAASWWRVSNCPCLTALQDAALLTGLIIAQGAVIIAVTALRHG